MVEILQGKDPVAETIAYLSPFYPEAVFGLDVPAEWEWGPLLIVVTDVGGPGPRDVVLDDAYISVLVSHEDSENASDIARTILGLLRQWPMANRAVYWNRVMQRPTYAPDEDTKVPAYSMTVALTFRASKKIVD